MFDNNARPDHTCLHCGGPTIWITRTGEHDVEGCPRCTLVGAPTEPLNDWLSGDLEIDHREKEKSGR
jgi:hypothetical protein